MSLETAVQYQDSLQVFIDYLKNDAGATWKTSFLKAVNDKGNIKLNHPRYIWLMR